MIFSYLKLSGKWNQTQYLYKIGFYNEKIDVYKFTTYKEGIYSNPEKVELKQFPFDHFYYTIMVNHSQHALNASLEINNQKVNEWLNPIFLKNDAYQFPIVLDPMRMDGNIDVNRQSALLKSRVITNVLQERQQNQTTGQYQNNAICTRCQERPPSYNSVFGDS